MNRRKNIKDVTNPKGEACKVVEAFVVVDSRGHMEMKLKKPELTGGKICFKMAVSIPERFFKYEPPTATIQLTQDYVMKPDIVVQVKHLLDQI